MTLLFFFNPFQTNKSLWILKMFLQELALILDEYISEHVNLILKMMKFYFILMIKTITFTTTE